MSFKLCFSSVLLMLSLPWLHVSIVLILPFSPVSQCDCHNLCLKELCWYIFTDSLLQFGDLHNLTSLFVIQHIYTSKAVVMWGGINALQILTSSICYLAVQEQISLSPPHFAKTKLRDWCWLAQSEVASMSFESKNWTSFTIGNIKYFLLLLCIAIQFLFSVWIFHSWDCHGWLD